MASAGESSTMSTRSRFNASPSRPGDVTTGRGPVPGCAPHPILRPLPLPLPRAAPKALRREHVHGSSVCAGSRTMPEPEVVDPLHHPDELLHVHRLGDVRIGVQIVAPQTSRLGVGGRQHDHRDRAQRGVGLDLAQQLAAVHARKVEVQQDQVGSRGVRVLGPPGAGTAAPSSPSVGHMKAVARSCTPSSRSA